MSSTDVWLVGFALRCMALLCAELGGLLYVVPTLFNLHSDLADAGAAVIAVAAVCGGFLWGSALTREFRLLLPDPSARAPDARRDEDKDREA